MTNRLPIDPLYSPNAQQLSRNEARRIGRYAMSSFTRAALWPVDSFEYQRHYRRVTTIQYIVFAVEMVIIALCLLKAATG